MIQGGDPTAHAAPAAPATRPSTRRRPTTRYTHGVVAMAKTQTEPAGTGGSQFFVVTGADAGLPPDYAVLGKVVCRARRRRPDRQARRPGHGAADGDRRDRARDRLGHSERRRRRAGRRRGDALRLAEAALFLPAVLAALAETDVSPSRRRRRAPMPSNQVRTRFGGCASCRCADWARGPGASLRCGLAALGDEVDARARRARRRPRARPARGRRGWSTHRDDGAGRRRDLRRRAQPPGRARARRSGRRVPDEGARALEPLLVACADLRAAGRHRPSGFDV